MTLRDYTANVISASKVVPDGNFKTSKASGVWDINEALDLIKGGNWPNAANLSPDTFVDGLFSIDLYDGTGSSRSITNNIDLTKGGLVWGKSRNLTEGNFLVDSERGTGSNNNFKYLRSDSGAQEVDLSNRSLSSFNNNGFTFQAGDDQFNGSGNEYVTWTFRKQPKFFDVVTYTGDGTNNRAISHSLGQSPGMIFCKKTNTTGNWGVFHRSLGNSLGLRLDSTGVAGAMSINSETINSSSFGVSTGGYALDNNNGDTYIAYLFAHNNNDGGFGEPGDQDIIKCGTYTNSGSGVEVNLGFEPQFMMFKRTDATSNWGVVDVMRSSPTPVTSAGDNSNQLRWNLNNAENAEYHPFPTPTGFKVVGAAGGGGGGSGTFVYMAIRRGGMQTPSTPSDVFKIDQGDASSVPQFVSNFPVDMAMLRDINNSDTMQIGSRLQGTSRLTISSSAEQTNSYYEWDYNNGYFSTGLNTDYYAWMWKRARGYFDVVTYTGTGSARTVSHNLGVVPEMMWLKRRNGTGDWAVYHASQGNAKATKLNSSDAFGTEAYFNSTTPTSSVFSLADFNDSGQPYIAYLFATVAGVSKIGSYTGNGSTQTIDCGFTSGARFVLIKKASGTGHWRMIDTTRGLVAGNDKTILLNQTNAQVTDEDTVDPDNSGFALPNNADVNNSGDTFIFYAIA